MDWQLVSGLGFGAFLYSVYWLIPGYPIWGSPVLAVIITLGFWFQGLRPLAKGFAIGYVVTLLILSGMVGGI